MSQDKVKILIVDDKIENIYALERILSGLDVVVDKATSGNETLSKCIRNEYAMILLDVQMPDMDGFETAKYLLENDATSSIPVIFITAINREESNVFKAYKTGAVDFLFKPINPDILYCKVKVFIELFKQKRALDRSKEIEALNIELKKNYKILEKKNEELVEFAYRTSHDLKLPLLSIKELSVAAGKYLEENCPDKLKQCLNYIKNNSSKLIETTNGILDLTRADFKEEEEVELTSEMIKKELFSIYEGIAKSNNIDLIFQSSFQNAFKTKKNKYIQILSNLISNSVKYFDQNKAQKYVKISLRQDSNYIIADVEDNGLGIPEKHHATIYDMFRRYHPQVSFGTGLGMAIIKKNVEKIKGKIEFKSVESQGTQFTIRIPYTQGVI